MYQRFLYNCTNRLLNMYTQMFPGVEQLCRSHSSPLNIHNILADLLKLEPTYFIFFFLLLQQPANHSVLVHY